jgi:hypothetical protein
MQFWKTLVTVSTDENYTLVTVLVQNEKYQITKLHGPIFFASLHWKAWQLAWHLAAVFLAMHRQLLMWRSDVGEGI